MGRNEVWKDVVGYEGVYKVSFLGRIKSMSRSVKGKNGSTRILNEKIMSSATNSGGYKCIALMKNGVRSTKSVHRLVAKAFIPNPSKKRFVNHIDGVKNNNHVNNLEWCTSSENQIHSYETGLNVWTDDRKKKIAGTKSHQSKLSKNDVLQIRSIYDQNFANQREISEAYEINQSQVSDVINKKSYKFI